MVKTTQLLNLQEVFKDRFFKIPSYQRSYSWNKKERTDLLADIKNLLQNNSDYKHFTGTLVLNKTQKEVYDIVDGQQRITTLIVLLKTYFDMFEDFDNQYYELFIDRGSLGTSRFTLELNSKDINSFFNENLLEKKGEIDEKYIELISQRNLKKAKDEFSAWWENNKENRKNLFEIIISRLGFLLYIPEKNEEMGIMFEVINNRGKQLSELEKVKNYLIYYSSKCSYGDISTKIDNKWEKIIENLSKIEFSLSENSKNEDSDFIFSRIEDNFLKSCWITFFDPQKKKSYNVYENLKIEFDTNKVSKNTVNKILNFIDFLINSSEHYYDFFLKSSSVHYYDYSDKILDVIKELRYHTQHASIMPLYLSLMNRYYQVENEEKKQIIDVLSYVEKLNFRIYGLNATKRADTSQGELFKLAYDFYNNLNEDVKYGQDVDRFSYDFLKFKLKEITEYNCPEEDIEKNLLKSNDRKFDLYKWSSLKYFLYSYEKFLRKSKQKKSIEFNSISSYKKSMKKNDTGDFYSIEHILPSDKTNIETLSLESSQELCERLGNFTLLEHNINIESSNKVLDEKIEFYNPSHVTMVQDIIKYYQYYKNNKKLDILYEDLINEREKEMVEFTKKRWSMNS